MDSQKSDPIRDFVIAAHRSLDEVKATLAEHPDYLHVAHQWSKTDTETAIQGAAHVGNREIVAYLLELGAEYGIHTAAMMGDTETVSKMLADDPKLAKSTSAHKIGLLPHVAFSGDADLVKMVYEMGATKRLEMALSNAIGVGDEATVQWFLENTELDLAWTNFRKMTLTEVAEAGGNERIIKMIQRRLEIRD